MTKLLTGQVALVAGATRGAGCGIARALGEAGAMVYCTGRSVCGNLLLYNRPKTIKETTNMILASDRKTIAIRVDHTVESEVKTLVERVDCEQGRLDILVNSVAGEDPMMHQWGSFWNVHLENGKAIFQQCILSHVITAKQAAPLMIRARRGM